MQFRSIIFSFLVLLCVLGCEPSQNEGNQLPLVESTENFQWSTEKFADLEIIRYQVPGWEQLTPQQRILVYYLTQSGHEGRDIHYATNYRHNLTIRKALEKVVRNYPGDRDAEEWEQFMTYTKRFWVANGIHHHYSNAKLMPEFSKDHLSGFLSESTADLSTEMMDVIFDPDLDAKKVNLDPNADLLLTSAINFYDPDVTQKEVEDYYANRIDKSDETPISYGLNSKIVRTEDGGIEEQVYKVGGLYGAAIEKMIGWLEKAVTVAENPAQGDALKLLIEYYQTGDLRKWDEYNIAWSQATDGDIDYISGFVEVYNDPLGYRGSYETIVEINDFEASERMRVLMDNVQWFEDQSTTMEAHKKDSVVGVTYKVVNVASESGDSSPITPIGVNLPNANWIRSTYGSKSVSLGNITEGYAQASGGGLVDEFALTEEEKQRRKQYGRLANKLHTALHEVVGHASGKIEAGVGTPKETLKNYRSSLEEARADLVSLYFMTDPKLVELGLVPSTDVGKTQYDIYIMNGLMTQLRRLELGDQIEQSHMRNRAMVSHWVYEKGQDEKVIEKVVQEGKTYFRINDYDKLRGLFGQLLREVQRIKSQGNYAAGRDLIENYGVEVDQQLHAEILERFEGLDISPYGAFLNPRYVPIMEGDEIVDVRLEYPSDFTEQMLYYSETFGNL